MDTRPEVTTRFTMEQIRFIVEHAYPAPSLFQYLCTCRPQQLEVMCVDAIDWNERLALFGDSYVYRHGEHLFSVRPVDSFGPAASAIDASIRPLCESER